MLPGFDVCSRCTDPAQNLITAPMGPTVVDDLDDLDDLSEVWMIDTHVLGTQLTCLTLLRPMYSDETKH